MAARSQQSPARDHRVTHWSGQACRVPAFCDPDTTPILSQRVRLSLPPMSQGHGQESAPATSLEVMYLGRNFSGPPHQPLYADHTTSPKHSTSGEKWKEKKTKISLFGSSLATPMKHLVGGTWNLPASPGCVAVSVRVRVFLAPRGSMTESWLSVSVYRTARVGFRVHPSSLIA